MIHYKLNHQQRSLPWLKIQSPDLWVSLFSYCFPYLQSRDAWENLKTNHLIKKVSTVPKRRQVHALLVGRPTTGKRIALTLAHAVDNHPYTGDNYDRILDRPLLPRLLGTLTSRSSQCDPRFGDVLPVRYHRRGKSKEKQNGQNLTVYHSTNNNFTGSNTWYTYRIPRLTRPWPWP